MTDNMSNQPYGTQPYGAQPYGSQPTEPIQQEAFPGQQAYPTEPMPQVEQPRVQPSAAPQHAAYAPPTSAPVYATSAPAQAKKGSSSAKTFLIAFAGALVACVLVLGVSLAFGLFKPATSSTVSIGASNPTTVEAAEEGATLAEAVADKCLPSVVSIDVYGNASTGASSIYDLLYGNTGNQSEYAKIGMGSGVILSDDGYIITNNHVVSGGTDYKVTIQGDTYDAKLIGTDSSSDVAVLKVDGTGFKAIEIGDSDEISIGEWVMSIGSPFGLEQSVATGIVSATSRSQIMDAQTDLQNGGTGETTIYPNMIQTDAAINPGNSGGALVDAEGQLIGINTMITSYSGNYSGVGFAIPSNYAISIAKSIIEGKEPTFAYLGITMSTVDANSAKRYGFPVEEGAYVSSVIDGSPAAAAGIKTGDIITAFDGKKVTSASDVMLDVRGSNPGTTVKLTINRDGQSSEVDVTLGQSDTNVNAQQQQQEQPQPEEGNGFGLSPYSNPFGR